MKSTTSKMWEKVGWEEGGEIGAFLFRQGALNVIFAKQ